MPENEEIINYIKRAFELKDQECYKQAIEMLYKALAIEPDNNEILFQIGELYFLLHNYPRAIQYPEQILEKTPEHVPSLKLLKNIYNNQMEFFSAKEIAEKILKLEPSEENLVGLINICGQLDLLDDLKEYGSEIEKSDKCLYAYANASYKNGHNEDTMTNIKKALALNPDNEDCKILLGKMYFDKNELDKSKEIFDEFGNNSNNPEVLNFQGLFAMEEGNFINAIKDFSKASNFNKKNPKYLYNLANAYFLNGWSKESESAYKNAICLAPENLDYRYSLAYLYYEYKEYDKAKKEIEFILETNGKHYAARVLKALLLYKDKNYLEAERILNSNIQEGCKDAFTLSSLAEIELELGKFDKAEEHLQTVIKENPDNLAYKCDLGEVYIKQKLYDKAINLANEITEQNENYISGDILGAKASYLGGDFDKTKAFAQEALSLDINCAEGYYYLALVRVEEKDYEEAIECMKRAITFDVTNAAYYAKMAEIYKQLGDIKTAFDYVKEAENIDPAEEYKILYREFAALNRK